LEQERIKQFALVERAHTLILSKPELTKSEAYALVEKEMALEERKNKGILPITPELRQALKDAGLQVSGEAHNALNVGLVPNSMHLVQLGKNGEYSKAAIKARLMEVVQACYIAKEVFGVDFIPEAE
jgi:hypothetical protein